ncbi:MAG: carbohydrate kinase family protein [Chloroflexi bacterium]|nr:carbohydrate kinase family protein [Chloroflexota bacterium]
MQNTADVVCFGMLIPALVLVVDRFPEHNTGAHIQRAAEFLSDDAAIVACLLRGWKVKSGLIGAALGNDARGKHAVRELKRLGVHGQVRLSNSISTPFEVNISDRSGHRTYFWQRESRVLDTLNTASLSLLRGAKLLYVDWYDGPRILRPMERAARLGIPIFLNLEHGHQDADVLANIAARATICQAVTDAAQREGDPERVARKLLAARVETALVTLAGGGCIAARRGEMIRAHAPSVEVVDGCGAGATFSAGIIYGHLRYWNLEDSVRFAIAAASLKCTVVGPRAFPLAQIKRLAKTIQIQSI